MVWSKEAGPLKLSPYLSHWPLNKHCTEKMAQNMTCFTINTGVGLCMLWGENKPVDCCGLSAIFIWQVSGLLCQTAAIHAVLHRPKACSIVENILWHSALWGITKFLITNFCKTEVQLLKPQERKVKNGNMLEEFDLQGFIILLFKILSTI